MPMCIELASSVPASMPERDRFHANLTGFSFPAAHSPRQRLRTGKSEKW
jgi:hypothetical protein